MTQAKTFKYKTNLARKMTAPGGRSVEDALLAADGALATHRDAAMQTLAVTLSALETACAGRRQEEVYEHASALLDMAGFFDTGPLYPAIFSLCEISDQRNGADGWDWPSVEVHVRAIQMLLNSGFRDTEDSRIILDGLVSVRQRLQGRAQVR